MEGRIKSINDFGIFVGLGDFGIDGLVHINDISNIEHPEQAIRKYKKGDTVKFALLGVDVKRNRVSLSIRQLDEDPMGDYLNAHPKGSVVKGKVISAGDKYMMLDLAEHVRGYIPNSELVLERDNGESAVAIEKGEEIEAKIIGIDRRNCRINLSVKKKEKDEQKEIAKGYTTKKPAKTSLGDVIKGLFSSKN